jgi:hypothetical protein
MEVLDASNHSLECAPEPSDKSLTIQALTSLLTSRTEVSATPRNRRNYFL